MKILKIENRIPSFLVQARNFLFFLEIKLPFRNPDILIKRLQEFGKQITGGGFSFRKVVHILNVDLEEYINADLDYISSHLGNSVIINLIVVDGVLRKLLEEFNLPRGFPVQITTTARIISVKDLDLLAEKNIKGLLIYLDRKEDLSRFLEMVQYISKSQHIDFSIDFIRNSELNISPQKFKNFLSELWNILIQGEISNKFGFKDQLWNLFFFERNRVKILKNNMRSNIFEGCSLGWRTLFIDEVGNIFPCSRFRFFNLGNISKISLIEAYKKSLFLSKKFFDSLECINCQIYSICRGCPAVGFSFSPKDPQCWLKL